MTQATCRKCGETKPTAAFARDASKACGRKSLCKPCDNAKSKAYYATGKYRHCGYCETPTDGQRFCTPLCTDLHAWERRHPPIVICDCRHCGVAFAVVLPARTQYCTPEHKQAANASQARARYSPERERLKKRRQTERQRLRRAAAKLAAWAPQPMRPALLPGPGPQCGACAVPIKRGRKYCEACSLARRNRRTGVNRTAACRRCEADFGTRLPYQVYCSKQCADADQRDRSKRKRRARKANVKTEAIGLLSLARRDGWRCHICKRKVTRKTWSMDHLVPLSYGGNHTWDNVALAHHICNSKRGAHGAAQLRLAA